ncbi:MAG: PAS domain-containing protein [Sedimentisphaerales bacterium]|nr:PAS domain-containing protein [Sedimentisphaerales bacterium]
MRRKTLLWQLYPSYLAIIVLSFLAIAWYVSGSLRQFYLRQTRLTLEARARLIQEEVVHTYTTRGAQELDALAKRMGRISNTRITYILPSGTVVADSDDNPVNMVNHADRPEIIQAYQGQVGWDLRPSGTVKIRMLYVAVPIREQDRIVGVLRTSVSLASVDEVLAAIYTRIAMGALVIAILAAALSFFASRRITRPLEEMRLGAEQFARGDLNHKLHVPDSQEIAALAESMNRMAADLDERIRTIVTQRNEQQAVLSSMVEGVLAVDRYLHLISLNDAAADLIGMGDEDPKGKSLQEVIRNTELYEFVVQALQNNRPVDGQIVLREGAGERYVQARGAALIDAHGSEIGAVVVLNDVTQLRRLENVRKDFVANVSHELKTPITSIKGFIETLMDGAIHHPQDAMRFLDIVARQTHRLNAIVDDLLTLSKIEQQTEKTEIELTVAAIRPAITAAVQLCELKAAEKQIQIEWECDETLRARINSALLEQAVVNLIDNAIKYSENDAVVRIEAAQTPKDVQIRVIDHGCGIEAMYLPRLFERFYRVDKARSRKLGGTGLGLAIVKHIAQAHGGRAGVQSTPGKGSTFTIHLPLP